MAPPLRSILDHAVLPSKLPGTQEENCDEIAHDFLKRLLHACEAVKGMAAGLPFAGALHTLSESLQTCGNLNQEQLDRKTLLLQFSQLKPRHVLICYVVEQNAAILIRREDDQCAGESVVIESFETSPMTEHVLAADNALVWDFPGRAVRLSLAEFNDEKLQGNLAAFLERASMEAVYNVQAQAQKAQVSVTEVRDTSDPALITQMLMILFEAIGESVDVPRLRKRIRDDVNFATQALLPWRRLPFWLVLRVAAQRHLHLSLGIAGRACYKLLMCVFFANLLRDASNELSRANELDPDLIVTLRAKLCRRMIKLEEDKKMMPLADEGDFETLFGRVVPVIEATIRHASGAVEKVWKEFKARTARRVYKLPSRASEDALRLSLLNSGSHLDELLARQNTTSPPFPQNVSLNLPVPLDKPIQERQAFTKEVFALARMERGVERDGRPKPGSPREAEARCQKLAGDIHGVFAQVGELYNGDPAQQSIKILTVFELWARMDECAIACCPLLGDYRPIFEPQLLDVLQLPTLAGMKRLQAVQAYIAERHASAQHARFLDDLETHSFAAQYVCRSEEMMQLMSRIQDASDQDRAAKERMWQQQTNQFTDYTEKINGLGCLCTWDGKNRNISDCRRCLYRRRRKRLTVKVHEDFLPESQLTRQSIVFELGMPKFLSAYRNATWKIVRDLAHPSRPPSASPHTSLGKCPQLQHFMAADSSCISFASIKKCFSETHYNFNSGLVPLRKILLPFAADFDLYDHEAKVWVKDLCKPLTLQHLCGVHIPPGLFGSALKPESHPAPDFDGPSSYEIQANLTKCPPNMSAAEFSAYQKLLAGKSRRWLNILVELGSFNLNFSNEDTTLLLSQLAVQAGPCLEEGAGVFRSVHAVMEEKEFVGSLGKQVKNRLDSVYSNWREVNCMELLINLSLRMFSLLPNGEMRRQSERLLGSARAATLEWISHLQAESRRTQDGTAASRIAMYGLKAALLCRRTFETHVDSGASLTSPDLSAWVRASVALQENLAAGVSSLPKLVRSMMIRDAKLACHLEALLHAAVKAHSNILGEALGLTLQGAADDETRSVSPWTSLPFPDSQWIFCVRTESYGCSQSKQVFHLDILEGHFLVNGKPRGSLPFEIRNDPSVRYLFGNLNLFVYPSGVPGMTQRLADPYEGYVIHFGVRGSQVLIQAKKAGSLFEFIPGSVFRAPGSSSFDLPASLLDNCAHWLDLRTGCIEVRRHPHLWTTRPRDWIINVRNRFATRGEHVKLVDPRSYEFGQIAKIFEHFEAPDKLTVFQPQSSRGKLAVELRHLDLSFHVNHSGLLFSTELKATIDLNQDAGTWYGLASKIVLRDATDRSKRSVIIPIGEMQWKRYKHDVHASIYLDTSSGYCRFDIDDIVGRLSSPLERRLLLLKAQCHAATSFCLPDPLTGHTGTEEAFRILRSGAAQPWAPFSPTDLKPFVNLLPQREYYPQNIKRLQRVTWDSNLTTTIQNDGFEQLIRSIEMRANRLAKFSQSKTDSANSLGELSQLRRRAQARRSLYERPTVDTAALNQVDRIYPVRDRRSTQRGDRVYQVAKLIYAHEPRINMTSSLRKIFETCDAIGGFCDDADSLSVQPLVSQIEEPISTRWGALVNMCRGKEDKSLWAFQLGLLAFNCEVDTDLLMSLVAFCHIKEIRELEPPMHATFSRFSDRGPPAISTLKELISKAYVPLQRTPGRREKPEDWKEIHHAKCEEQGEQLANLILDQWPNLPTNLRFTGGWNPTLINFPLAVRCIRPEWDRRRHNDELLAYVTRIDPIMCVRRGRRFRERPQEWKQSVPQFVGPRYWRIIPSASQDLVTRVGPELEPITNKLSAEAFLEAGWSVFHSRGNWAAVPREFSELEFILNLFAKSSNDLRKSYSSDLLRSLAALKTTTSQKPPNESGWSNPYESAVTDAIARIQAVAARYSDLIQAAFWAGKASLRWLDMGNLLPCSTPVEMLELLQSRSNHQFGPGMKRALITYGCAIAETQRLRRLRYAILLGDQRAIDEELDNTGHMNWDPVKEDPDWLLLEIDSNILIRTDQLDVARAIINPVSGENSVLQMNMGRGKTSCIMPMAAAVLANGHNVSRLIVPRSLVMQTALMMHSRLGGLVGREICHIPFSRQTPTTEDVLGAYSELHREIQRSKGFILTSHEHVLSYRLSGLQQLADGKLVEAKTMVDFQSWLDTHCRDVLDESDFTLSPKTQLNYPSGLEMAVDGHPFRWQVAQGLLSMVADHIPRLQVTFPGSIEVVARSCWFPSVQFLRTDVEDDLHRRIIDDVADGKAPFLLQDEAISEGMRTAIKRILSEEIFDSSAFDKAAGAFSHPKSAMTKLLVVRGLIVHRILIICLGKRWNVQYGLHPSRSPVAVPFTAKGVPSELSEYGHPDVAIVLTCLSFYSAGLSYEQFRQGLQRVLTSEDAASEYERWISESNLPAALAYWNLINVDDEVQMRTLWGHLRKNRVVTNHYMNNFVFPVHARQFTVKLQASSWDVPLQYQTANPGARTTGFSGTNDNRYMLPMTIQQQDLPGLLQTNAEVLSYLLQRRNREYAVLTDRNGRRLSERGVLEMLHGRGIQILIDAGAYILETENRALARMWFSIDSRAQSAVYFGSDNRPWVVFRDPTKQDMPLLATRLANNLEDCFVYFDEAHTRGVDLKLPENAHAALTLALKQTKDNTMQAAMRLRQLRTSQSVTFFAPPEVDMSIKDTCKELLAEYQRIQSPHVIFWLLEQTCRANEDLQPLFLAQGMDFCRRTNALLQHPHFLMSASANHNLLKLLQQPEHQTLDQLYGGASNDAASPSLGHMKSQRLNGFADRLGRYGQVGVSQIEALGEVEQERQIEIQIEAVREVQKPIEYQPLKFPGLSPDIWRFLTTGALVTGDDQITHAFDYISKTVMGKKFGIRATGSRLFVSREFGRTISLPKTDKSAGDRFLRPVEWILWSPSTQTALVIIPEEAELLIPKLQLADRYESKVHLIAYAPPVTRAMVPFNHLRYYSLPQIPLEAKFPVWLKMELGILAGRLYTDYDEWQSVASYMRDPRTSASVSPAFLLEWLGIRCRAHDVLHTPMGYICLGRTVTEDHPFFVRNSTVAAPTPTPIQGGDYVEDATPEATGDYSSEGGVDVNGSVDGSVDGDADGE
ncbi:hypothetical protein Trco_002224 [Trichoderma cornu-damae]|uniref:ubiquitinyl hydrolase 1 n=1 Tax=Trichoderma cornu-damae TaxID=654480 RepID=A0A9P8QU91_9HYPO|nr:hypothetical protein Trco_002224 [Trichoderma cornu-damae]